jgi:hypothetical protein
MNKKMYLGILLVTMAMIAPAVSAEVLLDCDKVFNDALNQENKDYVAMFRDYKSYAPAGYDIIVYGCSARDFSEDNVRFQMVMESDLDFVGEVFPEVTETSMQVMWRGERHFTPTAQVNATDNANIPSPMGGRKPSQYNPAYSYGEATEYKGTISSVIREMVEKYISTNTACANVVPSKSVLGALSSGIDSTIHGVSTRQCTPPEWVGLNLRQVVAKVMPALLDQGKRGELRTTTTMGTNVGYGVPREFLTSQIASKIQEVRRENSKCRNYSLAFIAQVAAGVVPDKSIGTIGSSATVGGCFGHIVPMQAYDPQARVTRGEMNIRPEFDNMGGGFGATASTDPRSSLGSITGRRFSIVGGGPGLNVEPFNQQQQKIMAEITASVTAGTGTIGGMAAGIKTINMESIKGNPFTPSDCAAALKTSSAMKVSGYTLTPVYVDQVGYCQVSAPVA